MSAAGLFTLGVLVTLIVAAAMAVLLYAAILDGRDAAVLDGRDAAALPGAERGRSTPARGVNLLQTARDAGGFETLVTAVDRAGLSDRLEHDGPYTVFAPSDEAFAKLPDGAVEALLGAPDMLAESSTTTSSAGG